MSTANVTVALVSLPRRSDEIRRCSASAAATVEPGSAIDQTRPGLICGAGSPYSKGRNFDRRVGSPVRAGAKPSDVGRVGPAYRDQPQRRDQPARGERTQRGRLRRVQVGTVRCRSQQQVDHAVAAPDAAHTAGVAVDQHRSTSVCTTGHMSIALHIPSLCRPRCSHSGLHVAAHVLVTWLGVRPPAHGGKPAAERLDPTLSAPSDNFGPARAPPESKSQIARAGCRPGPRDGVAAGTADGRTVRAPDQKCRW